MNVNDIKEFQLPTGDRLELIFERQKELMEKYHKIEEKQGVGYGILQGQGFDVNDIRSQELCKNFAWRVTEELAEATEVMMHQKPLSEEEWHHFVEEVADAFHFLVELAIILDITPYDLVEGHTMKHLDEIPDKLEKLFNIPITIPYTGPYLVIQWLGIAMNCLKQKPWKQTHFLTDKNKLRNNIKWTFWAFGRFCENEGIESEVLFIYYYKKSEVNKFRQRSNY